MLRFFTNKDYEIRREKNHFFVVHNQAAGKHTYC